ncbi:hypothetical protein [Formosimonas limnophila]|uniref:hypothetical protein n=1 Tax=Formosimonas limnophila TaxID=1384487 RepID=UPI00167B60BA|nr:hypothetical protein [Formosimonas limnophila]
MKLINSMTEDVLRKEILANQESAQNNIRLLNVIKEKFPSFKNFLIIDFLMEQGEDIYTLLIDGITVISLELSRIDESAIWGNCLPVSEYEKLLVSKLAQLRLRVTLDILK